MKKFITAFICLLFLIVMAPQVFGDTVISFGDSKVYWSDKWKSPYSLQNAYDSWGTPDILGGKATINDSGYLTQVSFDVKSTIPGTWGTLKPADLFIDTHNTKSWDYVVDLIGPNNATGNGHLYQINQPLDGSGYLMSYIPNEPDVRQNHPIGYEGGVDQGLEGFSGWGSEPTAATGYIKTIYFNFGGQDIHLGSEFDIAWSVNCANDVLYEHMNNPVPEPATLLLLGSGLIGLAVIMRKTFFTKQIG